MHLDPGIGVFSPHLLHQSSKLADLLLQVVHGGGARVRCGTGSRGRVLRPAERAAENKGGGNRQCGPANHGSPMTLHSVPPTPTGVRHWVKREKRAYGPGCEIEF